MILLELDSASGVEFTVFFPLHCPGYPQRYGIVNNAISKRFLSTSPHVRHDSKLFTYIFFRNVPKIPMSRYYYYPQFALKP